MKKLVVLCLLTIALDIHAATKNKATTLIWVGTWAASTEPKNVDPSNPQLDATTFRDIVHTSLGGSALRITLSNEYGLDDLKIAGAHVALSTGLGGSIDPATDRKLTFSGSPTIVIPAGAVIVSDPVQMPLAAFSDVAVSIALPAQEVRTLTYHELGTSTNFQTPGDASSSVTFDAPKVLSSWYFLRSIEVQAAEGSGAVVAYGDSITDGVASTLDKNQRWPDLLARRLAANKGTANLSVLNEGIGGNRVLHNGAFANAVARFDKDVLSQSGVKYVILLEGINDIGRTGKPSAPDDVITSDSLISGMTQLVARAHAHSLKVLGATLTPYEGAGYASPEGEVIRLAVNEWIRHGGVFDGVIDFDKVTHDPDKPDIFLPAYDHGDHLHPSDSGMKAMADSIDLKLFE